ncbi:hypothetical protein [Paeniglutamicibacter antarcticus]|uniref:Uncharacterized protein n=1 Tax=Paeniglutamicibacter antarcticus TaxID=494023 RepID=A0ABP9TIV4_9MICC
MTPVPGAAAAESFWARYGWLLAAVWIVFLLFPILSIAESSLPVPMRVLGYCLLAAFAAVYLWGFFPSVSPWESTSAAMPGPGSPLD